MRLKSNILQRLLPLIVLFGSWTFIGGWIMLFAREWLWLIIGSFTVFILSPQFFKSRAFMALTLYILVVFLNYLAGDEYYGDIVYTLMDIFQLVFYGGLSYFLLHNRTEVISKQIFYLEFFVIIFTCIATYMVDMILPGIVRNLVEFANNGESLIQYYKLGVCDYTMPHALPILIPPIILWLKTKRTGKFWKVMLLVLLLSILLLVWVSNATTPLILSLFALITCLFAKERKTIKQNIISLIVVGVFCFPLTIDSVKLGLIRSIESVIPDDNLNKAKLTELEDRIAYGKDDGGDISIREDLYHQSITSFTDHLIFGTNKKSELGQHSIALDRLGALGIVGAIPLFLFLWLMFKDAFTRISPNKRFFYLVGVLCFVLMIITKNVKGSWLFIAVFVLLPIMIKLSGKTETRGGNKSTSMVKHISNDDIII